MQSWEETLFFSYQQFIEYLLCSVLLALGMQKSMQPGAVPKQPSQLPGSLSGIILIEAQPLSKGQRQHRVSLSVTGLMQVPCSQYFPTWDRTSRATKPPRLRTWCTMSFHCQSGQNWPISHRDPATGSRGNTPPGFPDPVDPGSVVSFALGILTFRAGAWHFSKLS